MQKRPLLAIFTVVFIDLLGFGLILPLLPYIGETYGANEIVVGVLVASYSAAQLVGATLLGRLSDRFGRRPILLVSICGTLIGFVLLGMANTLWLLFISRILDGLTGGNISVARAYITDITDAKNRAKGMGLIGAAFGMGFVLGPAIGGILSSATLGDLIGLTARQRYALPAFAAAGLAAINLFGVAHWLTETLSPERRRELTAQNRTFSWLALQSMLTRPGVGPLLQISFMFGLIFAMFEGIFTLYVEKHLGLASDKAGYLLAYIGVLVAFIQGGAIGRLTQRYSEERLVLSAFVVMIPSLIGWAYAPNVGIVMIVLAPLSLSIGIVSALQHSLLTKAVSADNIGGVLGLATALGSITRIIGPIAGGILLRVLGAWAPGVVGAALAGGLLIFAWRHFSQKPKRMPLAGLEHTESHV